jgi:hypothetical protein
MNSFRGDATAIARQVTVAITTDDATTTFAITINTKTVSILGSGVSVTATAAALVVALNASTIPEFQEISWTSLVGVLAGIAVTPGVPFTATSSVSGGGGAMGAVTQTVASAGPNDWGTAQNWSSGFAPQGLCVAPTIGAPSLVAGGALAGTTEYFYVMTSTNANGESVKSVEVNETTTTDLSIALTWTAIPGATGYKIYRSTSTGSYTGSHLLAAISGGSTATYTDVGGALTAGSPPVTSTAVGDDVNLTGTAVQIMYSLNQSGILLNSLTIDSTYTGALGLPRYNASGGYREYRPRFLQIGIPTLTIGQGNGSGSGMVQIDCGSVQSVWDVYSTGQSSQQGVPALLLAGTNASNVLNIQQGNVGVAFDPGILSALATVNIGFQQSQQTDVTLVLGAGCTLGAINQDGGNLTLSSNVTTLNAEAGTTTILGTATLGTLNVQGGNVLHQSSGTLTAGVVGYGGTLDCSKGPPVARTFTNLTLSAGATFLDPNKTVTFTNPLYVESVALAKVTLDLGQDFHLQRS